MIYSIYAEHGEWRYPGQLDDGLIIPDGRGEGECVRLMDPLTDWMSASTAAERITGTQVNGWFFWKLRDTGEYIDTVRRRRLSYRG